MSYSKKLRLESDGATTTRRITVGESEGAGFLMRCSDTRTSGTPFSGRTESSRPAEWFRTEQQAIARAKEKFQASEDDGFLDVSNELTEE
jgi:hypothetical protein